MYIFRKGSFINIIAAPAALTLLSWPVLTEAMELKPHQRFRLYFPPLTLSSEEGERIEEIEIVVSCGRFRSLLEIPNDWSMEVISPVSDQTILKAQAGHGASGLWNMRDLDGTIVISVDETDCFDIKATIASAASQTYRRHELSRSKLVLKPTP